MSHDLPYTEITVREIDKYDLYNFLTGTGYCPNDIEIIDVSDDELIKITIEKSDTVNELDMEEATSILQRGYISGYKLRLVFKALHHLGLIEPGCYLIQC